jgi:hypothetical protein
MTSTSPSVDVSPNDRGTKAVAAGGGMDGGDSDLKARLAGTNINEQSFLATDYLNHFNEVVMLLEMIPDMPDCLEDVQAWLPKTYQQHFIESGFSDKELAVEAYEKAPRKFRLPFDREIDNMNALVDFACRVMDKAARAGDHDRVSRVAKKSSKTLQKHIDRASAIIHGATQTMEQAEIDGLLES